MNIEIKVRGAEGVARALDKIWDESQKNLAVGMRDVLHTIYQDAYRMCPVDTGALQNSILVEMKRRRVWIEGTISATGGAQGRHYAAYVELGRSGRTAKPFLKPAVDKNKDFIIERLGKAIEEAIMTVQTKRGPEIHRI